MEKRSSKMLPKDPDMAKVERLRVIQLFKVDYNFVHRNGGNLSKF